MIATRKYSNYECCNFRLGQVASHTWQSLHPVMRDTALVFHADYLVVTGDCPLWMFHFPLALRVHRSTNGHDHDGVIFVMTSFQISLQIFHCCRIVCHHVGKE